MTIEELRAYNDSITEREDRNELLRKAILQYAIDNDDEWLKIAVEQDMGLRKERIPWGRASIVEFYIGKYTVVWNHEKKTLEGPPHLIKKIKDLNEEWRGQDDYERFDVYSHEYRQYCAPPGDLWNGRAFFPLMARIFGDKIKWATIDSYPEDPMNRFLSELYPDSGHIWVIH